MEHQSPELSLADLRTRDPRHTSLDRDYNWGPNEDLSDGACTQTPDIRAQFQAVFDLEAEIQTKEIRRDREAQEALAKAICQGCGVLEECFDYVMPRNQRMFSHGVYAGLSSRERKKIIKDRKDTPNKIVQIKLDDLRVRGRESGTMQSANPAA